jgi:serine-protein kinase ATM
MSESSLTAKSGKRRRLEDPVKSLLFNIRTSHASSVRSYQLQTLLFLIDSHWSVLHESLKQDVVDTLLQLISIDENKVQSWIYMCFAALATAEAQSASKQRMNFTVSLDSVWTNAIRRVNTSAVCRAACHTAHALVRHMQIFRQGMASFYVTPQRILTEIEVTIRDLDVQGPPAPHDSVCSFLGSSLQVASQDMRLYRLRLEDKVLTWLIDCWKPIEPYKKSPLSASIEDMTGLIATICGFSRRCDLISTIPLPHCQIVQTMQEEAQSINVKNFMLQAKVPNEGPTTNRFSRTEAIQQVHTGLLEPKGRERRISAFLHKVLEERTSEWKEDGPASAEVARRSIDLAVIALFFQALLLFNGTQSDRQVVQSACSTIRIVTTHMLGDRWTYAERSHVISAMEPLIQPALEHSRDLQLLFTEPGEDSGVRRPRLHTSNGLKTPMGDSSKPSRIIVLRLIWQHSDVRSSL